MREVRRFLSFAIVGVIGFLVDACVLYLGIFVGLGLHVGRVFSYIAAVTTTWALNRIFTFDAQSHRGLWSEWAHFSVSQLGGAAANLGVYYLLIHLSALVANHPVLGVAAGSLSGLAINYVVARVYVFGRGSLAPRPAFAASLASMTAFTLLLVALVWPALYNRQPFFFPDTTAYIRGADAGIQAAFGHKSAWSLPPDAQKSVSSIEDKTVLTGRSPYYGALLYLGDLAHGFWLTVVVQACAILGAIGLALRAARVPVWPHGRIIAACVALATTAPFFSSLLMPDVFAGVAILTAAVLISVRERMTSGDYVLSFFLLTAATAFHDSHVLILFILLGAAAVYAVATRSWGNWVGQLCILLALMVGILAQWVFSTAVQHVVGAAPLRPPFLMARTIEDGPGYRYLSATCPSNGFKVCAFAERLPMMADDFLWKSGPHGVFATASPDERRELSNEQVRFLLAVVRYDPLGQLWVSLKDAAMQLTELGLTEFEYTDLEKGSFEGKIPAAHLGTMHASAAYRGTMPLRYLDAWLQGSVVIAGLVVAAVLLRRAPRTVTGTPVVRIILWTVLGILVNAAVCGILSGPHDRYSARVAWLLPFAALLMIAALVSKSGRPNAGTATAPAA